MVRATERGFLLTRFPSRLQLCLSQYLGMKMLLTRLPLSKHLGSPFFLSSKSQHKDVREICNLAAESAWKIWERAACQNSLHPPLTREGLAWRRLNMLLASFPFKTIQRRKVHELPLTIPEIWIDSLEHFRGRLFKQNRKGWSRFFLWLLWSL